MVSSVDIYFLCKEFAELTDAKVDTIYQPAENELVLRFYKATFGKKELYLRPPLAVHYTTKRPPTEQPFSFCTALRKRLKNARVKSVTQLGFSRIIRFDLGDFNLIVEFFDKGNIILTDADLKILLLLDTQRWKERTIAVKETYTYQEIPFPQTLEKKQLQELFSEGTVSKNLAVKVGLGGFYAQVVCDFAELPANQEKPSITQVTRGIQTLFEQQLAPHILTDKTPVPFAYKDATPLPTFSEGFDTIQEKKIIPKKSKNEVIIQAQTKQIEKLEKEAQEKTKIGEFIYEHFLEIETLLNLVKAGTPPPQCTVDKKEKTVTFEVKTKT